MKRILPAILYFMLFLNANIIMILASTIVYSDSVPQTFPQKKHHADKSLPEKPLNMYQQHQSEKILPFQEILKKVRHLIHGEIIETEFEMEHGIPIYEFKYIDKNGYVLEMEVDARTGKVLKVERD